MNTGMKFARALVIAIAIETVLCFLYVRFGSISLTRSEDNNFIGGLVAFLHLPGVILGFILSQLLGVSSFRFFLIVVVTAGLVQWFSFVFVIETLWKQFSPRNLFKKTMQPPVIARGG